MIDRVSPCGARTDRFEQSATTTTLDALRNCDSITWRSVWIINSLRMGSFATAEAYSIVSYLLYGTHVNF